MIVLDETLEPHEQAHLLIDRPILVAYRGSIAHGTHVPPTDPNGIDDVDLIGVYIPDLEHYFGLQGRTWGGKERKLREWDVVHYEVRHFASLLCQQNPNVLSLLWTKPEHVLFSSEEGQMLIEHRRLFSSRQAYVSFCGYAQGQLHRMTHWQGKDKFSTGYLGAKRKALIEKYGYDCKNASHLVRLLNQGIEFLSTGELVVDRREAGDAATLIEIKTGQWPLDRVKTLVDDLFDSMERAYASSKLPDTIFLPDVNKLLCAIVSRAHGAEVARISADALAKRWKPAPLVDLGAEIETPQRQSGVQ